MTVQATLPGTPVLPTTRTTRAPDVDPDPLADLREAAATQLDLEQTSLREFDTGRGLYPTDTTPREMPKIDEFEP